MTLGNSETSAAKPGEKKAISMWFRLADKVAERYGIPFTKIDELAKFMQSAAYAIVTEDKQ